MANAKQEARDLFTKEYNNSGNRHRAETKKRCVSIIQKKIDSLHNSYEERHLKNVQKEIMEL